MFFQPGFEAFFFSTENLSGIAGSALSSSNPYYPWIPAECQVPVVADLLLAALPTVPECGYIEVPAIAHKFGCYLGTYLDPLGCITQALQPARQILNEIRVTCCAISTFG